MPLTSSIPHVDFGFPGQAGCFAQTSCCSRSVGWFSCAYFRTAPFYHEVNCRLARGVPHAPAVWDLHPKLWLEESGMKNLQFHTPVFSDQDYSRLPWLSCKGTSSSILNIFPSSSYASVYFQTTAIKFSSAQCFGERLSSSPQGSLIFPTMPLAVCSLFYLSQLTAITDPCSPVLLLSSGVSSFSPISPHQAWTHIRPSGRAIHKCSWDWISALSFS